MTVPLPIEEVFATFQNPHNLEAITPRWLKFHIVTPDIVIAKGARIEYRLAWLGIPMRWETLISEYDPPHRFVDEATRGPYRLWRHTHTFESTADGTRVSDSVRYVLPFGVLGRIAHAAGVRRNLLAIFRYRQQALNAMWGHRSKIPDPIIRG